MGFGGSDMGRRSGTSKHGLFRSSLIRIIMSSVLPLTALGKNSPIQVSSAQAARTETWRVLDPP